MHMLGGNVRVSSVVSAPESMFADAELRLCGAALQATTTDEIVWRGGKCSGSLRVQATGQFFLVCQYTFPAL
jgi:hypothetical protein